MEERGQELCDAIARLGRQRRNDPVPEPLRGEVLVYAARRSASEPSKAARICVTRSKTTAWTSSGSQAVSSSFAVILRPLLALNASA
ncbi:MAG TPA: hypothetical protein DEP35_24215 [Deltaproteobacteria bacterium]|nr:hypothetical protein [Deltaproteobacteria bacterium]